MAGIPWFLALCRYDSFLKLQVNGNPALSNSICTRFPTAQTVLRVLSNKVFFLVKICTVALLYTVNVAFICTWKTKKSVNCFIIKLILLRQSETKSEISLRYDSIESE